MLGRGGVHTAHLGPIGGEENRAMVARTLLRRGANPNVRDPAGGTPLMQACYDRMEIVVRVLLQFEKVDIALRNPRGMDAYHFAVKPSPMVYPNEGIVAAIRERAATLGIELTEPKVVYASDGCCALL